MYCTEPPGPESLTLHSMHAQKAHALQRMRAHTYTILASNRRFFLQWPIEVWLWCKI